MTDNNDQFNTRIDDDLSLLSDTLEEVLRSSGDPADQKYIELKARAEKALNDVKARVSASFWLAVNTLFLTPSVRGEALSLIVCNFVCQPDHV